MSVRERRGVERTGRESRGRDRPSPPPCTVTGKELNTAMPSKTHQDNFQLEEVSQDILYIYVNVLAGIYLLKKNRVELLDKVRNQSY